jgi:hypothetical protein
MKKGIYKQHSTIIMFTTITLASGLVCASIVNNWLITNFGASAQEQKKQRDLMLLKPLPLAKVSPRKGSFNLTDFLQGYAKLNVSKNVTQSRNESLIQPASLLLPSTNVRVSVVNGYSFKNEPTVSVNPISGSPLGPERLVAGAIYQTRTTQHCGIYRSANGGTSWTNVGVLQGQFKAGNGVNLPVQADPVVRYARNGAVFYECQAYNNVTLQGSLFVSKSTTDGSTWGLPVAVIRAANPTEDNDKPWLAIDISTDSPFRDNIYTCWNHLTIGSSGETLSKIQFATSTNFGNSYSSPKTLSTSDASAYCTVGVGPDGSVFVAWIDYSATPAQLLVTKSTDGGNSFGPIIRVNDVFPVELPNSHFPVDTFPDIAIARNGDVHIVWNDDRYRSSGFGSDILIATSTDGAASWTTNDINLVDPSNTDQFFPTVAVGYPARGTVGSGISNLGTIHVFFYDKHYVSTPPNTFIDVTEADNHARGIGAFNLNKVTDVSSNPYLTGCDPYQFFGDYIDAGVNRLTHVVWTDCRNAARTGQDIYSATVSSR